MAKVYHRSDAAFKATLLTPPVDNVQARLMSPQDRGALAMRSLPSVRVMTEALASIGEDLGAEFDESKALKVLRAYREGLAEEIGPYAHYPADYNYLAHAIGSSPNRYEDWLHDLGGLHLTPGVTAVFAGTGVGKTTMADLVVFNMLEEFDVKDGESSPVLRIKLGESGSDLETFLRFSELAEALPNQLPPVIVIDSVRLQTFDMGGASRSLSISNQLFRWLTEIDIFAIGHGVAVILVMNPLGGEEEKIEQFRVDVESSVMSVVNLSSWNEGTFKHRGELNSRTAANFKIPGSISRGTQPQELSSETFESTTEASVVTSNTRDSSSSRTTFGRTRATQP